MAVLTVVWFLRALPRERLFLGAAHTTPARDTDRVLRVYDENRAEKVEVAFTPGPTVLAKGGQSLLEVAEANQVNMEAGCRMGMCGADPVRVTAGMENLSPVSSAERATLERLGLPAECRMACSAHVQGPVTVVPTADPAAVQGEPAATVPEEAQHPVLRSARRSGGSSSSGLAPPSAPPSKYASCTPVRRSPCSATSRTTSTTAWPSAS